MRSAGLGLARPAPIGDLALTAGALRWGALNGVMFLAVLAAAFIGGLILSRPADLLHALTGPTALLSIAFVLGSSSSPARWRSSSAR